MKYILYSLLFISFAASADDAEIIFERVNVIPKRAQIDCHALYNASDYQDVRFLFNKTETKADIYFVVNPLYTNKPMSILYRNVPMTKRGNQVSFNSTLSTIYGPYLMQIYFTRNTTINTEVDGILYSCTYL